MHVMHQWDLELQRKPRLLPLTTANRSAHERCVQSLTEAKTPTLHRALASPTNSNPTTPSFSIPSTAPLPASSKGTPPSSPHSRASLTRSSPLPTRPPEAPPTLPRPCRGAWRRQSPRRWHELERWGSQQPA
ncbi:hypothetical protein HPP92_027669 [Vanilla planifolia]|uniref:Uncharacterized protein n=1 Tax=Vanilla planifolia TaxID=51239 RepID=A0A835PA80_VANPL|nr:hypothetical protein HPP92_027669 [Vanilla planifolia]